MIKSTFLAHAFLSTFVWLLMAMGEPAHRISRHIFSRSPTWMPEWKMPLPVVMPRPKRFRMGHGKYKITSAGVDLICDFPPSVMLLSNIIWERADLGALRSLDEMYRIAGEIQEFTVFFRPKGSTLHLYKHTSLDMGLYRCITTAMDTTTSTVVTLFQDVPFYPKMRSEEHDHGRSEEHDRGKGHSFGGGEHNPDCSHSFNEIETDSRPW